LVENSLNLSLKRSLIAFKSNALIASMSRSYIPVKNATVPPETPGITLAAPIALPFNKRNKSSINFGTKKTCLGTLKSSTENYKRKNLIDNLMD
jgi:hypothetical protein